MTYTGLGHCYNKGGDHVRAIECYKKAITLDQNNKFAYNGLGVAYEIIRNDEMSIQNFNRAI